MRYCKKNISNIFVLIIVVLIMISDIALTSDGTSMQSRDTTLVNHDNTNKVQADRNDTESWIENNKTLVAFVGGIITTILAGLFVIWAAKIARKRRPTEEWEKEKIKELAKEEARAEIKAGEAKNREDMYLHAVRAAHQRIKLLGFLSQANIDVRLLDVFVHLRMSESGRERISKREEEDREHEGLGTPQQIIKNAINKRAFIYIYI